jgi:diguanylate cyclase (GGDEF)-like protein
MLATNRIDAARLPVGDRALMAPIAALMYGVAGVLVAVSVLVLPHNGEMNEAGMLALAAMGLVAAPVIWLGRNRWPLWFFQVTTASGSVILGFCVYWSGESNSPYSLLILWVAVFSAYFLTAAQTAAQLAFGGAVYAVALAVHPYPDSGVAAHWLLTMVAVSVAAGMVLALVTSRRRLELEREELLVETIELARTDPLTGLPNRRAWRDELDRELARASRGGALCVAMLDLDHFKRFNDEHGHVAGDELLQELAQVWSAALRPSDTLARYGGEEFALLLPDCFTDGAAEVVERLRSMVPAGQQCSAGLACWDGEEPPLSLIERADMRLYAAKGAGRDQLVAVD